MYTVHDRLNLVHVSPDFHLHVLPSDLHSFLKNYLEEFVICQGIFFLVVTLSINILLTFFPLDVLIL